MTIATTPKTKSWTFRIDGPLAGFRTITRRMIHSKDPKIQRQVARIVNFKNLVRFQANLVGAPDVVDRELGLRVIIHWKDEEKIDGVNVLKLVEDGLWKKDRAMAAGTWRRLLNQREECAIVTVEEVGR